MPNVFSDEAVAQIKQVVRRELLRVRDLLPNRQKWTKRGSGSGPPYSFIQYQYDCVAGVLTEYTRTVTINRDGSTSYGAWS